MKDSVSNIQFNYLHRDSGNYKFFGSLIFTNPYNLDIQVINSVLAEKLIDEQYFYPEKFGIKRFDEEPLGSENDWYEFESVELTDMKSDQNSTIEEFLSMINQIASLSIF